MIPVQALEALEAGTIGKGEFITLCHLARYVPGKTPVPVEGTTAELVEALGIPERTLQRHLVTLGSSGVVRCRQPQRGHWIVFGLCFVSETDASRQKWREPVVVDPDHQESDFFQTAEEQQQLLDRSGCEPPLLAGDALDACKALMSLAMEEPEAAEIASIWDPEYVYDVVQVIRRRGRTIRNPAGFARDAIRNEWPLPELVGKWFEQPAKHRDPQDYLTEGVQW